MKIKVNKRVFHCVSEIKELYQNSLAANSESFNVIINPFKVVKLNKVVNDVAYISNLKDAILSVPLYEKNNDLYSLKQSDSLLCEENDTVKDFIRFLRRFIQPFLQEIFGYKFNETISITTSLYQEGDVLLCHDDKCDDRCVAFVYYLNGLDKDDGGSFDMFEHDDSGQPTNVIHSVAPEFNSFVCFEVGNYTYHQVSEVLSPNHQRLSINGWFHSEKSLSIVPLNYKDPLPQLEQQILLEGLIMLDDYINIIHYTPSYISQVRETFSEESHILLTNFFTKVFFSLCETSLKNTSIKWLNRGPANRRRYQVADVKTLKGPLKTLISFVKSSLFTSYLKNATGLSLEPLVANGESSKLIVELQKWTSGCYTMATDNDSFFDHGGLDVYLFFNTKELSDCGTNCGGTITYLDATGDPADSDYELLSIDPADNSFCAVYRTNDTVKFTKYINHRFKGTYYCLSATYYELDEKF